MGTVRTFGAIAVLVLCGGRAPARPTTIRPVRAGPTVVHTSGATMGTYYAVTIAEPPETLPEDWKVQVDLELRQVNDQMSTYLKSSELSRFNDSESTEWFSVSPETAMVVDAALDIAESSGGALDVTVGPLVDAWSFGPTERTQEPPSEETIAQIQQRTGYQHLQARLDPPALRKAIPELRVDLSAIAKGHGVDRVVELLRELDCQNVYVDIGGENRAIGRRGNRSSRVAIEEPVEDERTYHLVLELTDRAIATSGDYRNFFEYQGQRYSHTIDPRTGRPVTTEVASVSVLHDQCMMADGWATALTVLGAEDGMEVARKHQLAVRIVVRQSDGSFAVSTTGNFPESILANAGTGQ